MGNNVDMVEVNRRALLLLEQVFVTEPYASMSIDQQQEIRKQLLPAYLKMEFDREIQEEKIRNPPLPGPPTFDPSVAAALLEQNKTLGQLKVEAKQPEFSLHSLETRGLTLKQQNDLSQIVKPLSSNFKLPCKQDLSGFWRRAERALKGLGSRIDVIQFGPGHIEAVGPVLLGEAVWELYSNEQFLDWEDFQVAIEKRFGLTKRQLLDAFDSMRPSLGENEAEFILRVEDKRAKLGQSQEFCVRHFIKLLSLDYRRELKRLRRVLRRSGDDSPLTWAEVVEDARDTLEYNHLTPEDTVQKIQGFTQQETLSPEEGQIAVTREKESQSKKKSIPTHYSQPGEDQTFITQTAPNPNNNKGQPPTQDTSGNMKRGTRSCSLCVLLGRNNSNSHNLSDCYANPMNPAHRPDIVSMRYKQITKLGIEIPECMQQYANAQGAADQNDKSVEDLKVPKIDKQLLYQLDQDFQQLLSDNGGDSESAFSEACLANLGYLIDCAEDSTPTLMFKDDHDTQATSKTDITTQRDLIKQHLIALQMFNEDEILAVHDEMEVDENKEQGSDASSDSSSDTDENGEGDKPEEEESDDDKPLANMKRKTTYHSSGAQTGGVRGAGRILGAATKSKKKDNTSKTKNSLGSQVNKLKILLPLFKGIEIKPNLRRYILSQAVLEAHQKQEKVTVVKGTKIREIEPDQLKEEILVYSEAGVDEEDEVKRKLKEIKKKYKKYAGQSGSTSGDKVTKSNYLAELVDSMKLLLDEDQSSEKEDKTFLSLLQDRKEYKLPGGSRGLPSWAPTSGIKNARGVCPASSSHYLALASVQGAFLEVTLDSGGGRSMIDEHTAKLIGLDVEWAKDTNKQYGTFSGVSGSSCQYLGVTKGPVTIQFAENVSFRLKELKVFQYPEPIVLIGTDLLSFAPTSDCTFSYLGVNPLNATGEVVFYDRKRKEFTACELVYSPTTHSTLPPTTQSTSNTSKQMQLPLNTKLSRAERMTALIMNRGQRL